MNELVEFDLNKRVERLEQLPTKLQARRDELEKKIYHSVQQSYLEIGAYLEEIAREKLFASTHWTFKEYCQETLDMAKSRAYQYVRAYRVVKCLHPEICESTIVDSQINDNDSHMSVQLYTHVPASESQARALVGLTPEEARAIWQEAVETAPDGKITAAHIRKTVRLHKGEQTKEVVKKAKRARSANKERLSESFDQAFRVFLTEIQLEIDTNWATTDRITVANHLDAARAAISQNGSHRIPDKGYKIEASNLEKLRSAGFTIYRMDERKLVIETWSHNTWLLHADFAEYRAMDEAMDTLMLETTNLRG